MKQFEKWLCKNYGKLMDGTSFEYNTKESWKAALKWVLSNYPDDAIYEVIKKELDED